MRLCDLPSRIIQSPGFDATSNESEEIQSAILAELAKSDMTARELAIALDETKKRIEYHVKRLGLRGRLVVTREITTGPQCRRMVWYGLPRRVGVGCNASLSGGRRPSA